MTIRFDTDQGCGRRARLGLVVLQSDETIEQEFARLPTQLDGVALYHTRIPSGDQVTADTLAAQQLELSRAAGLFPVGAPFDVIGYGCTSGATVIGESAVASQVHVAMPGVAVTNPLSALKAACAQLQVKRLGLVTPYSKQVTAALQVALTNAGLTVAAVDSFEQESEAVVARIAPASILSALRRSAADCDCDAWFVSCTNLRMAPITDRAEQALGVPVLSSNQVLAWHMLRLAGVADSLDGWGELLRKC